MPAPAERKSRVLIVDDHPIVREGLRERLAPQPDMEVVGEAETVQGALEQVDRTAPDLVIVDLSLPNGNGLDLIRQLSARHAGIRMLVLSAHDDLQYAERAIKAGAHGYVGKSQAQGRILEALRAVLAGEPYVGPEVRQKLISRALGAADTQAPQSIVSILSNRELQVFELIGRGRNGKSIAAELGLSRHTVDRHRENIKAKLGYGTGTELQLAAVRWVLSMGAPD